MDLVIRAVVIYVVLFVLLRMSGNRQFSELTAFDAVLLLLHDGVGVEDRRHDHQHDEGDDQPLHDRQQPPEDARRALRGNLHVDRLRRVRVRAGSGSRRHEKSFVKRPGMRNRR